MAELRLDWEGYWQRCEDPVYARSEWLLAESRSTNNESYFFRERDALDWVVQKVRDFQGQRCNIWSAGCARGEEPYSLMICLMEAQLAHKVSLLATDLDVEAVRHALLAQYRAKALRLVPEALREKYFSTHPDQSATLDSAVVGRVRFHRANLLNGRFTESMGPFHIILCRNVMIYFSLTAQLELVRLLHGALADGGVLVLGACESLIHLDSPFQPALDGKVSLYVKENRRD